MLKVQKSRMYVESQDAPSMSGTGSFSAKLKHLRESKNKNH